MISDNFAIRPNLLNEARFGIHRGRSELHHRPARPRSSSAQLGLTLLSTNPPDVTGTPSVQIAGYTNFGESQEEPLTQDTWQFADNVTWLKGRHTMKGGFDIKWFNWTSPVNFTGADDFGVFRFNNNIQAGGTGHPVRQLPARAADRRRSDRVGPERRRRRHPLRLLRAGRVARRTTG